MIKPSGIAPAVLMEGIEKRYPAGDREIRVLHGVSLRIEVGEFVAIVGPSGSGKTTLMNILGLMDSPSGGRYELNGRDVARLPPDVRAETRGSVFGFIFQRYNLLSNQTALENVELPGIYLGMPALKRRERAVMLLKGLGLGHRLGNRPNQLSGGEQQRVAVSRALLNGGGIILADEPTGALDTARGRELMDRIHALHAEGRTVILITHDPSLAAEAGRVIRMVDGRILSDEIVGRKRSADSSPSTPEEEKWQGSLPAPLPPSREKNRLILLGDVMAALRTALRALRANLFRSFLTMLGIIVGVASVLVMLGIGEGVKQSLKLSISGRGANMLVIQPGSKTAVSGGMLTLGDADAIRDMSHALRIIPDVYAMQILRYRDRVYACVVCATSKDYPEAMARTIVRGSSITREDDDRRAPTVLLGMKPYLELFPTGDDPVGRHILINNAPFLVVGVFAVKGSKMDGRDREDDLAIIPIKTGEARILRNQSLTEIRVEVDDFKNVDLVQDEIRRRLMILHQVEDFHIYNQAAQLEAAKHELDLLQFLLASAALVTLVVGGAGVMNIMLVNVVERTREIGVRMACGARARDIQLQFLTEAVVICLIGGLLGVALGVGVAHRITVWDSKAVVTILPVLLSLGAAFATGILFGFWPARKASLLDPVVALSSE